MSIGQSLATIALAVTEQSILASDIQKLRYRVESGWATDLDRALLRGFERLRAEALQRSVRHVLDDWYATSEAKRCLASREARQALVECARAALAPPPAAKPDK
jgi:hypothetical protein